MDIGLATVQHRLISNGIEHRNLLGDVLVEACSAAAATNKGQLKIGQNRKVVDLNFAIDVHDRIQSVEHEMVSCWKLIEARCASTATDKYKLKLCQRDEIAMHGLDSLISFRAKEFEHGVLQDC